MDIDDKRIASGKQICAFAGDNLPSSSHASLLSCCPEASSSRPGSKSTEHHDQQQRRRKCNSRQEGVALVSRPLCCCSRSNVMVRHTRVPTSNCFIRY